MSANPGPEKIDPNPAISEKGEKGTPASVRRPKLDPEQIDAWEKMPLRGFFAGRPGPGRRRGTTQTVRLRVALKKRSPKVLEILDHLLGSSDPRILLETCRMIMPYIESPMAVTVRQKLDQPGIAEKILLELWRNNDPQAAAAAQAAAEIERSHRAAAITTTLLLPGTDTSLGDNGDYASDMTMDSADSDGDSDGEFSIAGLADREEPYDANAEATDDD
jgi:hypothetical protein